MFGVSEGFGPQCRNLSALSLVRADCSMACAATGPVNYGATVEAATPWLQLALYVALRQGPPGMLLPAGQRLWRLPPLLAGKLACLSTIHSALPGLCRLLSGMPAHLRQALRVWDRTCCTISGEGLRSWYPCRDGLT